MRTRIERLAPAHDVTAFSCGDPSRDGHLAGCHAACSDDGPQDTVTYVAVRRSTPSPGGRVLGYYTLSTGLVRFRHATRRARRRLAEAASDGPADGSDGGTEGVRYPVPVARLTHLALDLDARSFRLRVALVVHALRRVGRGARAAAVRAFVVRAWTDRTGRILSRFGFRALRDGRRRYVLSVRPLRQLAGRRPAARPVPDAP